MSQGFYRVVGMEELGRQLKRLESREAKKIIKTVLQDFADEARAAMQAKVPIGQTRDLFGAIVTRNASVRGMGVEADVGITHGKRAAKNAFYWHFLEFGTVKQKAQAFIVPSLESMRAKFEKVLGEKFFDGLVAAIEAKKGAGHR